MSGLVANIKYIRVPIACQYGMLEFGVFVSGAFWSGFELSDGVCAMFAFVMLNLSRMALM